MRLAPCASADVLDPLPAQASRPCLLLLPGSVVRRELMAGVVVLVVLEEQARAQ